MAGQFHTTDDRLTRKRAEQEAKFERAEDSFKEFARMFLREHKAEISREFLDEVGNGRTSFSKELTRNTRGYGY